MVIQKLVSSVVQIVLFSLIPFIWWLIAARKESSFWEWIGFKKVKDIRPVIIWGCVAAICFLALSIKMLLSLKGVETAVLEFAGAGATALPAILIYAVLNTALPEEVLFRGFLLKRLAHKFGFFTGNLIQSFAFGLMHGIMFFTSTGPIKAAFITIFTGAIGWLMGFINEKKADGSIIPGWCIHSAANLFSGICSAFLIFL